VSTEIYCRLTINRLSYHTTRWLLLDRLRWLISSPRSLYPREWYPLPTEQEAGVAPVYVWTLWKGENTLLLPRFSAQFTQPVTQSHKYPTYLNVLFTALCCARMRARQSTSLSLLPSLWDCISYCRICAAKKKWFLIKFVRLLDFYSILILFRSCTPRISALFDHLSVPFTWNNRNSTIQYSILAPFSTAARPLTFWRRNYFFFNFTTPCT
jgi:hypothetical protein